MAKRKARKGRPRLKLTRNNILRVRVYMRELQRWRNAAKSHPDGLSGWARDALNREAE